MYKIFLDMLFLVLLFIIEPYTKADNAAANVYTFPWMGPKSTTRFIHLTSSD